MDTVTTRPFLHLEIYENEYRVSTADERLLTRLFACSVVRVNALSTNRMNTDALWIRVRFLYQFADSRSRIPFYYCPLLFKGVNLSMFSINFYGLMIFYVTMACDILV